MGNNKSRRTKKLRLPSTCTLTRADHIKRCFRTVEVRMVEEWFSLIGIRVEDSNIRQVKPRRSR